MLSAGVVPVGATEATSAAGRAGAETALQEVVITGSRIARPGLEAPTATTVIGADAMEQRGITNVASLLNQVPAFRGSSTPSTNVTVFREGAGGNFVNLRGLGATRTLVLIDGNPVVPTTSVGTVDLTLVPAIMIERSEVVTVGASAACGSDAAAGVVTERPGDSLCEFRKPPIKIAMLVYTAMTLPARTSMLLDLPGVAVSPGQQGSP